jgi:hypothetical protein
MKYSTTLIAIVTTACSFTVPGFSQPVHDNNPSVITDVQNQKGVSVSSIGERPVAFIENKGQLIGYDGLPHPEVKFYLEQKNVNVFLFENGLAYQFTHLDYPEDPSGMRGAKTGIEDFEKRAELCKSIKRESHRMDMRLEGAAKHLRITPEKKSSYYINYQNTFGVHAYERIRYHEVYPGIDWEIYIKNGQVKHEFIVHPGADPDLIKMVFTGYDGLTLANDGSFSLRSSMGTVTEMAPVSFQRGEKIRTAFVLERNVLSFQHEAYSNTDTLVIDPSIMWSTYFGGPGFEWVFCSSVDASGNVYISGTTASTVGIASSGHQNTFGGLPAWDAFLVKFNSSGTFQWATYYGGSGHEEGWGCATDGSGNVYLSGLTGSSVNIASGGHQNVIGSSGDAFLVKFNAAGIRQWGTYYGGSGLDAGFACATDLSGNVYLAGSTTSTANIASGGFQNSLAAAGGDAFIVKMNGAGQLQWASYYGGSGGEDGWACTVDVSGNVFLAGYTASTVGIASGGHQSIFGSISGALGDAFLVKFNSSGARQWATYYGGEMGECPGLCATDGLGNVFMVGYTQSTVGIASGGYQNTHGGGNMDCFIVKFSGSGVRQWGTYFGGTADETCVQAVLDGSGGVYVTGTSSSTTAIVSGSFQNSYNGGQTDAILARFSSGGQLQWASYFGGNSFDSGMSCSYDPAGYVYLAGHTTSSFSMTSGSYQGSYAGGNSDAFLVKICDAPGQPPSIVGKAAICGGVVLTNTYYVQPDPSATSYSWNFPSAWSGTASSNSLVVTPNSAGTITVTLQNACGTGLSQTLAIVSSPVPTISVNSGSICTGQSFTMVPTGAFTYTITGGSTVVSPTSNSTYSVTGTNSVGCTSTAAAVASVAALASPVPTISVNSGSVCIGQQFTLSPAGASTYSYSGGTAVVGPTANASYSVTGTSSAGCISNGPAVANVLVYPLPTITVNSGNICRGQSFTLVPGGAVTYTYSGGSSVVSPTTTTTYYVIGTSSIGCVSTLSAASAVNVLPTPNIIVNSGTICVGQTHIFYPSGANSFTYSGGSSSVSPATTTGYSVTGTNLYGCVSPTPATPVVTVYPLPTVTANSGSICSGHSYTITPSGANTYTYSSGNAIVNPLNSTTFSVTGTSSAGCVSGNTALVNVTVVPTPTISANSGSICSGQSFTIAPAGASSYSYINGGPVVSPSVTANYSVVGTGTTGCVSNPVSVNVTVVATPTVTVNSGSICTGATFTLVPGGGFTYTFTSSGPIVNPSVTTSYSVTGTGAGGCISATPAIGTVTVHPLPNISVSSGSICTGQMYTITPSGASTYSFTGGSQLVSPTVSTTYTVSGTSAAGCASTAIVNVTVAPLPSLTLTATRPVLCAGETVTLNAFGAQAYSWQGGSPGSTLAVSPTISSTYTLTGIAGNGCSTTATLNLKVNPCNGIGENIEWAGWSVYPNPCTDELIIEGSDLHDINIFNALGQLVLRNAMTSRTAVIDVHTLANGIYFLKDCCSNRVVKVIKE